MYKKAQNLEEVAREVEIEPLDWNDERYADVSAGRGKTDVLAKIRECLLEYSGADNRFGKIAFTGHRGSGKSTELLHLEHDKEIKQAFTPFHVYADETLLGLEEYDYTDLFLWLVDELARRFHDQEMPLNARLVEDVAKWFDDVTVKQLKVIESEIAAEAEVKSEAKVGLFSLSFGILARLKSMVRGSEERRTEIHRKLQERSEDLIQRVNMMLGDAKRVLREHKKPADLLIVVDNLDRLSPKVSTTLFFKNGEALKRLDAHVIYTVPIAMILAPNQIGKVFANKFTFPTIKIRTEAGRVNKAGIDALTDALGKRVEIDQVFSNQRVVRNLAEMSGGNIRDFMRFIQLAQRDARVENKTKIDTATAKSVLTEIRIEYEQILVPRRVYHPLLAQIHYTKSDGFIEEKHADPESAQKYRDFLRELLFNGSILEYNGDRTWYDVHPVVQEIDAFKKALADVERQANPETQEE